MEVHRDPNVKNKPEDSVLTALAGEGFVQYTGQVLLSFFWILVQVSRKVTIRLKTGLPGEESVSTIKYP